MDEEKTNKVLAWTLIALVLLTVVVGIGWVLWNNYKVEPVNWSNYYNLGD
jgi:predicted negative regulator of RcsB-dependent stress response